MVTVEDCILGNSALHDRFFATTEILAKLVSSAPRAVSVAQLEDATGRPARELAKLCNSLSRANLLKHDPSASDKWLLTCDPGTVTLEDVFRCVLADQHSRSRSASKSAPERVPSDVDLLVMQAMIAINQSVFRHLRQFSLDRLKISAAGMFPSRSRQLGDSCLNDSFDLAMSDRDASYVSSVRIPA
ncbi:Rrf2 family transcriptional regulator [Noviherbaspirillum sp.]|uniref:Rrf2 family transcriptional regulator n=1 Tax=Noviherbaspirillum sp. TaxID=1926288 RepID=UPI002B47DBFB|nr:Rrf2 family transcriptional regulator [Noviherbaspirillum sp.]HJV83336.1 Rrf2 family transcriptional regulator [Noviherbaspirillum sp.]